VIFFVEDDPDARAYSVEPFKNLNTTMKVLFTTGYSRDAIGHHGRLERGVHLLSKSFSFEDVAVRVPDVLDR
jgi:hypothetical protein